MSIDANVLLKEILLGLGDVVESLSAESLIRPKRITLTDVQIKNLPKAPVEVISAPGEGKGLILHRAYALLDTEAGNYTGIDDDAGLLLTIGDYRMGSSNPYFPKDGGQNSGAGVKRSIFFLPDTNVTSEADHPGWGAANGAQFIDPGRLDNQPMTLTLWNGADNAPGNAALGGGNANNKLYMIVWYSIMETEIPS